MIFLLRRRSPAVFASCLSGISSCLVAFTFIGFLTILGMTCTLVSEEPFFSERTWLIVVVKHSSFKSYFPSPVILIPVLSEWTALFFIMPLLHFMASSFLINSWSPYQQCRYCHSRSFSLDLSSYFFSRLDDDALNITAHYSVQTTTQLFILSSPSNNVLQQCFQAKDKHAASAYNPSYNDNFYERINWKSTHLFASCFPIESLRLNAILDLIVFIACLLENLLMSSQCHGNLIVIPWQCLCAFFILSKVTVSITRTLSKIQYEL